MTLLHAIDRCIVARDIDRDGIDIGRDTFGVGPERQGGEGEQARTRADVRDVREALPALQLVERGETACGGRVLARSESEARVDLEVDRVGMGRVGWRMDMETAGADWLQTRLAHRHPIGLAELFQPGLSAPEAGQMIELVG